MKRTLKAILFADFVGYSRQMSLHEDETLGLIRRCFKIFHARAADYGGTLIKTTGDGAIVEFESASAAVDYAMSIHGEWREARSSDRS